MTKKTKRIALYARVSTGGHRVDEVQTVGRRGIPRDVPERLIKNRMDRDD